MTSRVDVLPPIAVPALLSNAVMSNSQFQFTVKSVAQRTNVIQATTHVADSPNWTAIATLVPATNTFILPTATPTFSRFDFIAWWNRDENGLAVGTDFWCLNAI